VGENHGGDLQRQMENSFERAKQVVLTGIGMSFFDIKASTNIDRYWKLILLPKLIPFAKECLKDRSDILVQEDNAAPHAHRHQETVYNLYNISRLLWPGNSPDLNAIEPAWFWLKKRTTARGPPTTKKALEQAWLQAWDELPQEKIQEWISAIPHHIQEVIRLEGGNEYKEGVKGFKRSWQGLRIKGKLSKRHCID
jgi:transposase